MSCTRCKWYVSTVKGRDSVWIRVWMWMCNVRIKIRWMVPHLWIYSCFLSEVHIKRVYHTLGILIIIRIWAERTKPFAKCDIRHEPMFYKEWMHTTWIRSKWRWVNESTQIYRYCTCIRGWVKKTRCLFSLANCTLCDSCIGHFLCQRQTIYK